MTATSVGGSGDNAFSGAFTSATFKFNSRSAPRGRDEHGSCGPARTPAHRNPSHSITTASSAHPRHTEVAAPRLPGRPGGGHEGVLFSGANLATRTSSPIMAASGILKMCNPGAGSAILSASGMEPGDTRSGTLSISNDGSVGGSNQLSENGIHGTPSSPGRCRDAEPQHRRRHERARGERYRGTLAGFSQATLGSSPPVRAGATGSSSPGRRRRESPPPGRADLGHIRLEGEHLMRLARPRPIMGPPIAALLAAALVLVPGLLGYQRYVIKTGSMTGTIDRGSLIFDKVVPPSRSRPATSSPTPAGVLRGRRAHHAPHHLGRPRPGRAARVPHEGRLQPRARPVAVRARPPERRHASRFTSHTSDSGFAALTDLTSAC